MPQRPGWTLHIVEQTPHRLVNQLEGGLNAGKQAAAGFGRHDAEGAAVQEPQAETLLSVANSNPGGNRGMKQAAVVVAPAK